MTGTEEARERDAEAVAERTRELARTHDELRVRRAETSDFSAAVHEHAARVHEELGNRSTLDPQALREHAHRDRDIAAQERAALASEEDVPELS